MAPAMPCKTCKKNKHGESRTKTTDFKSKLACLLEASESTRLLILQEKGTIHCNILIWYTNLFLCLKPLRYPQQKQQWTKEWEKLEKFSAWNLTKVRSKKEVIDEARTKGLKVHFAFLMDICHLKNAELDKSTKNTKVELYSEVILWKTIQGLLQYSLNKDHQHHKWQQQKSWKSFPYCWVVQDNQLMQYLLILR